MLLYRGRIEQTSQKQLLLPQPMLSSELFHLCGTEHIKTSIAAAAQIDGEHQRGAYKQHDENKTYVRHFYPIIRETLFLRKTQTHTHFKAVFVVDNVPVEPDDFAVS